MSQSSFIHSHRRSSLVHASCHPSTSPYTDSHSPRSCCPFPPACSFSTHLRTSAHPATSSPPGPSTTPPPTSHHTWRRSPTLRPLPLKAHHLPNSPSKYHHRTRYSAPGLSYHSNSSIPQRSSKLTYYPRRIRARFPSLTFLCPATGHSISPCFRLRL